WKFLVFSVIIMAISIILIFIPFIGEFVGVFILPFDIIFAFLIYEGLKKMRNVNYSEDIGRHRNIGEI
ncbi:MAG: hypothetical protein U9Q16_00635, partial [Patescibacteria group bacterium]|nr:hypothetical protein [Patescibacteria group bacterium]